MTTRIVIIGQSGQVAQALAARYDGRRPAAPPQALATEAIDPFSFRRRTSEIVRIGAEVPVGGEDDYVVLDTVGTPRDFAAEGFEPLDHLALGAWVKCAIEIIEENQARPVGRVERRHQTHRDQRSFAQMFRWDPTRALELDLEALGNDLTPDRADGRITASSILDEDFFRAEHLHALNAIAKCARNDLPHGRLDALLRLRFARCEPRKHIGEAASVVGHAWHFLRHGFPGKLPGIEL